MTGLPPIVSDEELTAFLDGELPQAARRALEARLAEDSSLADRLEALRRGGANLKAGFDALLAAAPEARLATIFADIGVQSRAVPTVSAPVRRQSRSVATVFLRLAAALVLFVAGAAAGVFGQRYWGAQAPEPVNWRVAVADYLSLYTRESLSAIPNDPERLKEELASVSAPLGITLSPDEVALPDLDLKRAQLLRFRDKPLVQLAYLPADDGPVAFCIILNGAPDADPKFESREGQNIVFWSKGGRGFLIIGRTPRPELEALAQRLQSSVS